MDWKQFITQTFHGDLKDFVTKEYENDDIFPKRKDLFRAFQMTAYEDVKVVILGQDPYHGEHQAHGLSFSVQQGVALPPSLRNIFQELVDDMKCKMPCSGDLSHWATQGVLLLNTVLTVRKGEANSHKGKGWEAFTDKAIAHLNEREKPVIFVLWGKPAQKKASLITNPQHKILTAPHPSPLSAYRGFFGSKPFSKINQLLADMGETPITW